MISLFKDIISPELPKGSSILITDIESELSDATNANNHVKVKWKPLRKQVPFTVPCLYNIYNQGRIYYESAKEINTRPRE